MVDSEELAFKKGKKTVIETTIKGTGCMQCKLIDHVANNAHCDICKNWYHLDCGIQTKQNEFKCPLCKVSSKLEPLNGIVAPQRRRVGRPSKKQKVKK